MPKGELEATAQLGAAIGDDVEACSVQDADSQDLARAVFGEDAPSGDEPLLDSK